MDENTLEFALKFKKFLRWDIGEIVYLKSDFDKKCPMVISGFNLFAGEYDYACVWSMPGKEIQSSTFLDKILYDGKL